MKNRKKFGVILGTRPEVIKLYPVIKLLGTDCTVVSTGQQNPLLTETFSFFSLQAHCQLDIERADGSLNELHYKIIRELDALFDSREMKAILVQGDTLTAFSAGLAAYYRGIPVVHVEAGLRTFDYRSPFPEEMHRRFLAEMADIHFAPSENAWHNLIRERIPETRIFLVGNTVIDTLQEVMKGLPPGDARIGEDRLNIMITIHRRENLPFLESRIIPALKEIAAEFRDIRLFLPVHPNPAIKESLTGALSDIRVILLLDPLPYDEVIRLMMACDFVVTDSGGLQEEATATGKPLLVLREKTERIESICVGNAIIIGTDRKDIVMWMKRLITDHSLRSRMSKPEQVYGDGNAAGRIVQILKKRYG